eukprot:TRINITY_DN83163_c0_g1_i1.p1 TRINITY_DN83163_c0_g1~~TRINITY_DN83163_c0_g1_i1.p1  ORF type:complete len:485 (+),score=94.76 TRINITY_DN83163_c0_g1_i1:94-1548(+)
MAGTRHRTVLLSALCIASVVAVAVSDSCAAEDSCERSRDDSVTSAMLQRSVTASQKGQITAFEKGQKQKEGLFATVPVKWVIITKKDGTGNLSKSTIQSRMAALRKSYSGGDPNAVNEEEARKINAGPSTPDSCGLKCDLALCYEDGKYKSIIDLSGCWCEENYCKKWTAFGKLHGKRADAAVGFTLQSVSYVANDDWHNQCCCSHAGGLSYKPKQWEIFDKLVDKATVRSVVTIMVCDMGATAGQSIITGSTSCEGGPGMMLTTSFDAHTLTHEFGHYFGLHHTFNEYCKGEEYGDCKKTDLCDETKNLGDSVADTPIHKKQGSCTGTWDVDSCPGGGPDPLDNVMSYSGCKLSRFTPGQVKKMHQTITDFYPAFLATGGGKAKDLPCNPGFPSLAGKVPAGYNAPAPPPPPPAAAEVSEPHGTGNCNLEAGQCDTYDGKGCVCHDASFCCKGYGCGGLVGQRSCLPCEWKAWGTKFTVDSCK